jgi:hypothetical protein
MKTTVVLVFQCVLLCYAAAGELVPEKAPAMGWKIQVVTDNCDDGNHEGFTIELCAEGTGHVYHWLNRGWKQNQNEKTEIGLSRENTARVYALAAIFIREFSLAEKWSGPPGKELLAVGITMNGGGVSCRREQCESAIGVSSGVSELIHIVNAALPKEKRIH